MGSTALSADSLDAIRAAARLARMYRLGRLPFILVLAVLVPTARTVSAFDLDDVAAKAQKLAEEPFQDPHGQVPTWLLELNYDQWRDIRFRPEAALWKDEKRPFQVQFFHPGLYYDRTVAMNIVDAKGVRPVGFSPSLFDYGKNTFASRIPQDLGFAGFRIHYPIKTPNYLDEVIVFVGASYFRALGRDQVFGLSARGIAIDTAVQSGEEFPYFKEFWLVKPAMKAKEMTIYALLDSPSLTGAYRFVVRPGKETSVAVDMRVFLRREVQKLGIAPLTSMCFHGENSTRPVEDFRPEVHDSDGLLLEFEQGEWLWRPLDNPHSLNVSALGMHHPRGFGLLQRDRNFDHYQDLETHTELRPSVWIAPRGEWGDGHVELIEIPTNSELNDNIVAFWVPAQLPKPGTPFAAAYTMYWYGDDPTRPPAGQIIATRRDRGPKGETQRFIIDFDGKKLRAIPADQVLRGVVTIASGPDSADLVDQHVVKNTVTGGWRLTFQVKPKGNRPVELRAFLDHGGDTLTETWSYALVP